MVVGLARAEVSPSDPAVDLVGVAEAAVPLAVFVDPDIEVAAGGPFGLEGRPWSLEPADRAGVARASGVVLDVEVGGHAGRRGPAQLLVTVQFSFSALCPCQR